MIFFVYMKINDLSILHPAAFPAFLTLELLFQGCVLEMMFMISVEFVYCSRFSQCVLKRDAFLGGGNLSVLQTTPFLLMMKETQVDTIRGGSDREADTVS